MDTTGRIGETVRKKDKTKLANPFLPDDLIPNILSRLPAKSAIRCRLVCRRWRDLTLDREFVDLQFRNSIPTILVANPRSHSRLDLFALDKWWEPADTRLTLHRFPFNAGKFPNISRPLFSNDGLVVFRLNKNDHFGLSESNFIILNPTSRENVRITLSKELHRSKIYGVYFHPLLKEYCSLWLIVSIDAPWDDPEHIQYKMLNLGSKPSFKNLSNPFSNRYFKMEHGHPLFINNYLYWTIMQAQGYPCGGHNDIMEFDIISEEFTVIPCPAPLDTECGYYQTNLLNIDDILSFLLILPSKITIWRLEDHAEKFWTATEYTFSIPICPSFEYKLVSLGAVVDGKLALLSEGRLLVCNLMQGTVLTNYQKRKYRRNVMFLSYRMSLASLRNCKPTIFIDQDVQVVV